MKLALTAPYPYNPNRIPGGVAYVSYVLSKGFEAHDDVELHIVALTRETSRRETIKVGRSTVHFIPEATRRIVPNMIQSIGKVNQELRKIEPDVVYSHSSMCTLGAFKAGLPTVHCVHGVVRQEARVAKGKEKLILLMKLMLENKAVANARHLVAISRHTEQEYRSIARGKFHRIDNPVEDEYFACENAEEAGRVLYVGSISRRKNLLGLLSAVDIASKKMPEVQLVVAGGSSDPAYGREVREFMTKRGLSERVQLLGLVERRDLPTEMARCAIYSIVSREENAPCAIAQAMAAGKPVVASDVGGIPDMVEHGKTGYLTEYSDTAALAGYILEMLADHDLRRSMGEEARNRANQRFRKEIAVARALEVCNEALSNRTA